MKYILSFLLFLFSVNVFSQEVLITDRPDQTESPNVVGAGVLQIESGVLFEKYELSKRISQHRTVYILPIYFD